MGKEKWKVYKGVFDEFTLNTLDKLAATHHFDELESPLFMGKESNVFIAKKGNERLIVKIYRLENCDFNKMHSYLMMDPRYFDSKKSKRLTIFSWVQREFRNLQKAREAGVNVPMPIKFVNNVLLESLIGKNEAAHKLKDLIPEDPEKFYKLVVLNMKKLAKAGIVHGDLSEFNILNDNEMPVIIDMSQSTPRNSTLYYELLERDSRNIAKFFSKLGVETSTETLMAEIKKEEKDVHK